MSGGSSLIRAEGARQVDHPAATTGRAAEAPLARMPPDAGRRGQGGQNPVRFGPMDATGAVRHVKLEASRAREFTLEMEGQPGGPSQPRTAHQSSAATLAFLTYSSTACSEMRQHLRTHTGASAWVWTRRYMVILDTRRPSASSAMVRYRGGDVSYGH